MSCHEMTGDRASPVSRSQQTMLERCAAKPAASTVAGAASFNAPPIACSTDLIKASGSCSTQSGPSPVVSTATDACDTTTPPPSNTSARLA